MRKSRIAVAAALAAVMLASTGCGAFVRRVPRPVREDVRSVPLSGARSIRAEVDMRSGELSLRGGANGAMTGRFEYNRDDWRPRLDYAVLGEEGRLELRQPDERGFWGIGSMRNAWDLQLADDVPLDLTVRLGAGASTVDLRGLELRDLHVRVGAGESTVDLTGVDEDLSARIEAGAGDLTLRVPTDIRVRLVGVHDGVGEVNAAGFRRDGDSLVSSPSEPTTATLEIAVRLGAGELNVLTDE